MFLQRIDEKLKKILIIFFDVMSAVLLYEKTRIGLVTILKLTTYLLVELDAAHLTI